MSTQHRDGLLPFFILACGITWGCAWPLASAWWVGGEPAPAALSLAGLSAFGPTVAAVLVGTHQRRLRAVFGPWRTHPKWILLALVSPLCLQVGARLAETMVAGSIDAWAYPPNHAEQLAALVVFSVGEEFGWRGFAHPRLVTRFGPVRGSLLLGGGWALWHLMFLVSETTGRIDIGSALMLLSLPAYSIIYAWFLQRGRGSLGIALALHAGMHLDNANRMPSDAFRLRLMTVGLVAIAAVFAARSLLRKR